MSYIQVEAQQIAHWSSFYENGFIWNPALTGKHDHWELSITHRQEWIGFDDAPQYSSLAFQLPILSGKRNTKSTVGLLVDNDQVGPLSTMGGAVAYNYKMRLDLFGNYDDALSIGFLWRMRQFRFNPDRVIVFDNPEVIDFNRTDPTWNPNVSIGAFYISKSDYTNWEEDYYYFGVSANELIPLSNPILNLGDIRSSIHTTIHGGFRNYIFRTNNYFEPNLLITYAFNRAVNVMANFRYENMHAYWLSAGIVSNGELFAQAGLIFNDESSLGSLLNDGILRLGIKADYGIGKLYRVSGLGFEIYMAYQFEYEER